MFFWNFLCWTDAWNYVINLFDDIIWVNRFLKFFVFSFDSLYLYFLFVVEYQNCVIWCYEFSIKLLIRLIAVLRILLVKVDFNICLSRSDLCFYLVNFSNWKELVESCFYLVYWFDKYELAIISCCLRHFKQ